MTKKEFRTLSLKMRNIHRYVGFFMMGIFLIYAFTGTSLIFRDTFLLKKSIPQKVQLEKNLTVAELAQAVEKEKNLHLRHFKISHVEDGIFYFDSNRYNAAGTYSSETGIIQYTGKEYPHLIQKLIDFHKSTISDPLSFLNILFAVSLLLFIATAFFMFPKDSPLFKKGLIFMGSGILLTLLIFMLS